MEILGENVALDNSSQSTFTKAVKNIQRLIKKGTVKVSKEAVKRDAKHLKRDPKPTNRGVVYLTHVPHGFYENAMLEYFSQFGKVTGVKLVRSKKTGNSRGFAFVEFLHTEVAKIAAETMNNYLMYDRLIKAEYVPPEKQRRMVFSRGTNRLLPVASIKAIKRKNFIMKKNRVVTPAIEDKSVARTKKKLADLKNKLEKDGITLNFKPMEDVDDAPVISLDMSDPEIDFTAPSGTIVRHMQRTASTVAKPKKQTARSVAKPKEQAERVTSKRSRRSKSGKTSAETKAGSTKNTKTPSKLVKVVKQLTKRGLKSVDNSTESAVKKSKVKSDAKSGVKSGKQDFGFIVTPRKEMVDKSHKKLDISSAKKKKEISYSGKGKGRRSSVKH